MTAVDPSLRAPAPDRAAPEVASSYVGHAYPNGAPAGGRAGPPAPGRFRQANERRPWLAPSLLGAGVALATAYTSWQDPHAGGLYPGCPLRSLTGWDCPGCGGLRATNSLTHGDVAAAFDHNVFVTVGIPIAVVVWVLWLLRTIGVPAPRPRLPRVAWGVLVAAVLAFSVVRNVPGVAAFEYLNSFT